MGGTYTPAAGEQDRACICSFARLCADNFSHTEWLYDGQILRDATPWPYPGCHGPRPTGPRRPCRRPLVAPPGSELHLVGTGYAGSDKMSQTMLAALSRFVK